MILFLISFGAGLLTVLAPCVLPLLPIIIGGSVGGESEAGKISKKKPITIAVSLGLSLILFTFLLKVSTVFINIPPTVWAIVSGVIIIIFGLFSLFPDAWDNIPLVNKMSRSSNKVLATGYKKNSFWGDVIIGASLGPVFSSCSPVYFVILATVLPLSFFVGFIDLLAYATGLAGALLIIAFLGQKIVSRVGGLTNPNGWFKKSLGILFILVGIAIMFGYDKKVEAAILNSGVFDITKVEQKLLSFNKKPDTLNLNYDDYAPTETVVETSTSTDAVATSTDVVTSTTTVKVPETITIKKLHGPKAPEIVNASGYINTGGQPITIGQFKGKKVVLIDFWTYSCINCQRTLPYVKAWDDKYKNQGLEIISIHTPEFAFEKVQANVQNYVTNNGINYPVVMDNDYSTWNAFGNQFWPRKYLINEDGEIIYDHKGEGSYDVTEKMIQNALIELNQSTGTGIKVSTGIVNPGSAVSMNEDMVRSPETYFGFKRNSLLANGVVGTPGEQTLTIPENTVINNLYLDGTWNFNSEYATAKTTSKIIYKYSSKNVYMVASSDTPITISILKDGVKVKDLTISSNTLYTIIQGSDYGEHTLEIDAPAGLNAFTFTFG